MTQLPRVLDNRGFFTLILALLVLTNLAILFDIPVLRPALGLLFFTIVPGLMIIYILRLNTLGLTGKAALSVGLSIAFLMFAGLFTNSVYTIFGYAAPLAPAPVAISLSIILLVLIIFAYFGNRAAFSVNWTEFRLNIKEKAFLLLPAILPVLSVLGMRLMNATGNNAMLILLLSLIPAYVIFLVVMRRHVPERIYPAILFLIGISFVLLVGMRSNHIIGRDTHWEYYLFQLTYTDQQWQIHGGNTLDACLSISLLPAIYQSLMNINPEYLFKMLYPVLFSVSPLVVFIIARKYVGSFYAFLAAFFFISQFNFYWTAPLARINLAVLFFFLTIMVFFHDGINELAKKILFIALAISCIVSHYSTTYIFFFVLLCTWLGLQIFMAIVSRQKKAANPDSRASGYPVRRVMTISGIAILFVALFFWYGQVIGSPWRAGVGFIVKSFVSLQQLFLVEARSPLVAQAMGQELGYSDIPVRFKFVLNWLIIAFIAIGILSTLARYRSMLSFAGSGDKPNSLHAKIDPEFFILSAVGSVILVFSLVFPHVSVHYGMDRVYFQMTGIFSVFLIIGVMTIARLLKLRPGWLLLMILIPFFLGNAGLVDQMYHRPIITLNSEGSNYNFYYIHDQESHAARWLSSHGNLYSTGIYTDVIGGRRLISQGRILSGHDSNWLFQSDKKLDGYIYLGYHKAVNGKLLSPAGIEYDSAEYQDRFTGKSRIYSNGGSEIYR